MKAQGESGEVSLSIRNASILIVGVGGLGCSAALELSRAGVGRLGLMDPDSVDGSNLHRQVLYEEDDIGNPKAEVAVRQLRNRYPAGRFEPLPKAFSHSDGEATLRGYDLVIDGLDRMDKKHLLNDACVTAGKPFVHAGVLLFGGQVLAVRPGVTACLRCLLPSSHSTEPASISSTAGILGPVAQWVGYWQAREAVRLLSGDAKPYLWSLDALRREIHASETERNPTCAVCGGAS